MSESVMPQMRFFTRLRHVTRAFDGGRVVELVFDIDRDCGRGTHDGCLFTGGEIRIRVPADTAPQYAVGDEYALRLYRVA